VFHVGWSPFFSPHALIAAVGWIVASGMAIPHIAIDQQHRLRSFVPTAICCLGLVVALLAAVLEHERTRFADQQQQVIADGIANIARALDAKTVKAAAPDQVLATAAAKLVQQSEELAALRQQMDRPAYLAPNPDVLYRGDVPMAVVDSPIIDNNTRRIVFKEAISHSQLDMTTPFLFRSWTIRCVARLHTEKITGTVDNVKYWDLPCQIEQ
jgi:hypothetical protein